MSGQLERLILGPVRLHGSTVVIRPPRLDDHRAWRAVRLRDRACIEPFWHSSRLGWAERHTERQWIREYLEVRAEERAGRQVPGVIEVDGQFAGQCDLCRLDFDNGSAELSIWVDSRLARQGLACVALGLVLDHAFDTLGLERVVAPISLGNAGAVGSAKRLGFVREALMSRYFDAGGARRDHSLWALTRAEIPPKGFTQQQIQLAHARSDSWEEVSHEPRDIVPRTGTADRASGAPTSRGHRLIRNATVLALILRMTAGRIRRRLRLLRGDQPVRLAVPGHPGVVLRTRTLADGSLRRAARVPDGTPPERAGLLRQLVRRRTGWWREFARSRGGLRSTGGLVLALDVNGRYAGEYRLFDLDMFDRNARLAGWIDPARADLDIRRAAIRAMLDHAFGPLGLYRVATEIAVTDTESAAVAAHAGLLQEGIVRNHLGRTGHRGDHGLWALSVAEPDGEGR
ncbi:GNAT family N-acetyltransferase [Nocardia sp. alder85J]|uniref:GNAT family N-acetyltransferase n=1 Tax=Nocardia sp. alder85J TaxID=2862949 RepID=UPI001CD39E42|nr:GNAT family protein [Nocardia sp. alder85J]MCX4093220.1 GNAT family protein [Nocardia sp. alder85J]